MLRADPDVILVGEMRDRETMAAALTAAALYFLRRGPEGPHEESHDTDQQHYTHHDARYRARVAVSEQLQQMLEGGVHGRVSQG